MAGLSGQYFVTGQNLIDANITADFASTTGERYAEIEYDICSDWHGLLSGDCLARYATYSTLPSGQQTLYAWAESNLTQLNLITSGGRAVNCPSGVSGCAIVDDSQPGVYIVEGDITYDIIFYDPVFKRLGDDPYRESRTRPYGFHVKVVAPFVEPDPD